MSVKDFFDSFGEEFWKFISKYLITALLSFVFTTTAFLLIPKNNNVLNTLGKHWYLLFLFSIFFIIIEIIKKIYNNYIIEKQLSETKQEIINKDFSESVRMVQNLYDNLEVPCRNIFDYLVKSKNEPVTMYDDHFKYQFEGFLQTKKIASSGDNKVFEPVSNKSEIVVGPATLYQCKLEDNFYNVIKKMYKNNIKISKF